MAGNDSALSRITPQKVAQAAALVRTGRVYDLGAEMSDDMPATSKDVFMPYRLLTYRSSRGLARENDWHGVSFYTEVLMATPHVSTHIDALSHVVRDGHIYGGHAMADVEGDFGLAAEGIETVPPIITRGVLIDVAAPKGAERLPDHYEISVADLQGTLVTQHVQIERGDAVLVRTGKMRQYGVDNAAFVAGQP